MTSMPDSLPPTQMLRETAEAPDVVARLIEANAGACAELGARLRAAPPAFVVTCARGSSDTVVWPSGCSNVSSPTGSASQPTTCGICFSTIRMPMPASIPLITADGKK